MMVRIDYRQFRLERGFLRPTRQPGLQLGVVAVGQPAVFAFASPAMFPPLKTRPFSAILLFRRKRKPGGRSAHCQELRGAANSSTVYGCHKPSVARLGAAAGDKSDRAAGSYVKFARRGVAWLSNA